MKPNRPVGLVGYGAYIPRYRIAAKEISRVWTDGHGGVPVVAKSVPGPDEDVITNGGEFEDGQKFVEIGLSHRLGHGPPLARS